MSSDATSIYDKHLNERHSVTLEKHWKLSAGAPPRTQLGSSRHSPRLPSRLRMGKPLPHSLPQNAVGVSARLGSARRLWRIEPWRVLASATRTCPSIFYGWRRPCSGLMDRSIIVHGTDRRDSTVCGVCVQSTLHTVDGSLIR